MEAFYAAMSDAGYKTSTVKQYKSKLNKAGVTLDTEWVDLSNDKHGSLYRAFKVFKSWRDPETTMYGPRGPNQKKTNLHDWSLSCQSYTLLTYVYYLVKDKKYAADTAIIYGRYRMKGEDDNNKHYARSVAALKDFEHPLFEEDISRHAHDLALKGKF